MKMTKPKILQLYLVLAGSFVHEICATRRLNSRIVNASSTSLLESYRQGLPTTSPTAEDTIRDKIIRLIPEASVPGTPHYAAAEWLETEDPLALQASDDRLYQRYTTALFWFVTTNNGLRPWRSCNKAGPSDDPEVCTFLRFARRVDDSVVFVPEPAIRWVSRRHECDWVGVQCEGDRVPYGIRLIGQHIQGKLPVELTKWTSLGSITLPYNELSGTLPEVFADVPRLTNLELDGNALTGTIPNKFWNASLRTLDMLDFSLGGNMLLGTISTEVGQLTGLKAFHLFENFFTGGLPNEIGQLRYLSFTRLNENGFEGTIPSEFGQLQLLTEFWLHTNLFTGSIPSELGQLQELTALRLESNILGGSIPEELYGLNRLYRLDLDRNSLTGTLSTNIGNLNLLEILRLSRNLLEGTFPTEIAQFFRLRLAWLHLNQFEGSVPIEYCANVGPGLLEFLQVDCLPPVDPPNPCLCCSACCNRDTKICLTT